ncbi:MAG TPA: hypothetical protein VFV31_07985 [Chitinophagaceae bacterium]|nr:hypothetical protein [Chitinophagaceae bacterium]
MASNTDLVNSGSYLTELLVVVLGITTFDGFGGSFLVTGATFGFIETNDLGSTVPGFLATGLGAGAGSGLATGALATTGLATGLGAGLATGFAAGLVTFFGAGLAAFFGAAFAAGFAGFFAGFGADFFTVFLAAGFLAAGFPPDRRAGLGAGLAAFLGACFFLVAINYPFFDTITFSKTSFISIPIAVWTVLS